MCAKQKMPEQPTASVNLFQEMLDLIEDLSGVRTVIYDRSHFTEVAGRVGIDQRLSGHRSGFCQGLRVTEAGDSACVACDIVERTLFAAKSRRPVLHTCHAGLTEVVFPVMYRGEHVATVFCGQAAVEDAPANDNAFLRRLAKRVGVPPQRVIREYKKFPVVTKHKLLKVGEMLFNALNYLAESEGRAGLERSLELHRHPPVQDALAFVEEHYAEPVGLAEAAEHSCVAPEHLSRLFHRVVGVTFSVHLTARRIEHAKELLTTTSLDMSTIAAQCGYSHQSYFGRKFRHVTGMTPLQYRAMRGD